MKYWAFLPHFVSVGGWLDGSGWCACEGGWVLCWYVGGVGGCCGGGVLGAVGVVV